jgi:hypothetical protein
MNQQDEQPAKEQKQYVKPKKGTFVMRKTSSDRRLRSKAQAQD